MVQTAEADVIGPAVTTDTPDRLLDQVVGNRGQQLGNSVLAALDGSFKLLNASTLCLDTGLAGLVSGEDLLEQLGIGSKGLVTCQFSQVLLSRLGELVNGQTHTVTELGVVLEQGV